MMRYELKNVSVTEIHLTSSLTAEEFAPYIAQIEGAYIKEVELPGFRKGKAPLEMVIARVGEGKILEEAASKALAAMYRKIVEEHKIEIVGRPQVKILKLARGNPLEWEAEMTILPPLTLSDYKEIAKTKNALPREPETVEEKEITDALTWLQNSRREGEGEHVKIPELTDGFARSVGKFENLEELRMALKTNIAFEKEEKARQQKRADLMEAIASESLSEIPGVLVEHEKEKMLHELEDSVARMGVKWEEYLSHMKKTEDALKGEWTEDARKRVRAALILREIGKREHVEPDEAEVLAWVEKYVRAQDEDVRKSIDLPAIKDYAYGILRNEKVLEFLEHLK